MSRIDYDFEAEQADNANGGPLADDSWRSFCLIDSSQLSNFGEPTASVLTTLH